MEEVLKMEKREQVLVRDEQSGEKGKNEVVDNERG